MESLYRGGGGREIENEGNRQIERDAMKAPVKKCMR